MPCHDGFSIDLGTVALNYLQHHADRTGLFAPSGDGYNIVDLGIRNNHWKLLNVRAGSGL